MALILQQGRHPYIQRREVIPRLLLGFIAILRARLFAIGECLRLCLCLWQWGPHLTATKPLPSKISAEVNVKKVSRLEKYVKPISVPSKHK